MNENVFAPKKWTAKDVEYVLTLSQGVVSLNTPINEGDHYNDETELEFIIADEDTPSPEEVIIKEQTRENLNAYLQKYLKPREIQIIKMRYGFESDTPMTLEEIGQEFGMTRERIRQIEARALRRLRGRFVAENVSKEDI